MKSTLIVSVVITACSIQTNLAGWINIENSENFSKFLHHKINVTEEWDKFTQMFDKKYNSVSEEAIRFQIYSTNLLKIVEHNSLFDDRKVSFKLKMNEYGDLSSTEFATKLCGYKPKYISDNVELFTQLYDNDDDDDDDEHVDWRKMGLVTDVKNQGVCGSCWAFSTTGVLEGQLAKASGYLVPLSEQNLMDCSFSYGNEGCEGGYPSAAIEYVMNNGIESEDNYSYLARDDYYCRYNTTLSVTSDYGMVWVPQNNEQALKKAVQTVGPISVAIHVSHSFQFYSHGIFDDATCYNKTLNHAVLVVGYGTDEDVGKDYWIVKNSWGQSWGDSGYIRMSRNNNNQCGIATSAVYPII